MHHLNDHSLASVTEELIDKLRDLVSAKYLNNDSSTLHVRAIALVARLKALHREANTTTRLKKDATAEARQEMDQSHLNLQNLLYEKRHLEREIEKCRQFASIYQDIPLYTLEEFKWLAPGEARTEQVLLDEHQLMLNRLSFELAERQRLDLKRKELIQQKEQLLKESRLKEITMESIKSHIDVLVKTAADVQKKVNELVQPVSGQPNDTPN